MQSVKIFMRQIGIPNGQYGVESAKEVEDHIQYQFTSAGYTLQDTHYLGDVRSPKGDGTFDILGYKVMFIFVKDEEFKAVKSKKEIDLKSTDGEKVLEQVKLR